MTFQSELLREQVAADGLQVPESLFSQNDIELDPDEATMYGLITSGGGHGLVVRHGGGSNTTSGGGTGSGGNGGGGAPAAAAIVSDADCRKCRYDADPPPGLDAAYFEADDGS